MTIALMEAANLHAMEQEIVNACRANSKRRFSAPELLHQPRRFDVLALRTLQKAPHHTRPVAILTVLAHLGLGFQAAYDELQPDDASRHYGQVALRGVRR